MNLRDIQRTLATAVLVLFVAGLAVDGVERVNALRRSRNGLKRKSGISRPAKAPAPAVVSFADRGIPPVFAAQLDKLIKDEPTYQPVMLLGDKTVECQCGARAVWLVLAYADGDQADQAGKVFDFGAFCSSCWQALGKL